MYRIARRGYATNLDIYQ